MKLKKLFLFLIIALFFIASCSTTGESQTSDGPSYKEETVQILWDYEDAMVPANFELIDVDARIVDHKGSKALQIDFHRVENPKIVINFEAQDWSAANAIVIDFYNPDSRATESWLQMRDNDIKGTVGAWNFDCDVPAEEELTWYLAFEWVKFDQEIRDQGLGIQYPGWGDGSDLTKIIEFSFWQWQPARATTLIVDNIRLVQLTAE